MITSCGARTLIAKTCNNCGELCMAKSFPKVNGIYHNSWCRTCSNAVYKHLTQKHQQTSLKGAVKHRQPWTEVDFTKMEKMTAEGLPVAQIALALNRSVYAVNTMRNKLKRGLV